MLHISPTNKVTAAAAGAPLAVLIAWLLEINGIAVPTDVAISLAAACSFALAWFVNDRPGVR